MKFITPQSSEPLIKMVECDICGAKKSANQLSILPNELAQPGIDQVCAEHVAYAAREFYEPLRAIFSRMKEENEWKK